MRTHNVHRTRIVALAVGLSPIVAIAGCSGTSTADKSGPGSPPASRTSGSPAPGETPVPAESNPPGDIPDNLAFVSYTNAPGRYRFVHPEGWAETQSGVSVEFTDKLNGVNATSLAASAAPTEQSARQQDVPRLQGTQKAFELRSVTAVTLPGGSAVRIVFRRNSDPDPVTGRQHRDEVEEYVVFRAGREVRLDLFGPVGADNVDAYRTMSQSLRLP
jgi:hypothetical protein